MRNRHPVTWRWWIALFRVRRIDFEVESGDPGAPVHPHAGELRPVRIMDRDAHHDLIRIHGVLAAFDADVCGVSAPHDDEGDRAPHRLGMEGDGHERDDQGGEGANERAPPPTVARGMPTRVPAHEV